MEPGLHRVLVGGCDIREVSRHQRADMVADDLLNDRVLLARQREISRHARGGGDGEHQRGRHRRRAPIGGTARRRACGRHPRPAFGRGLVLEGGGNAQAQLRRRREAQCLRLQGRAELALLVRGRPALRAAAEVGIELGRLCRIELALEMRQDEVRRLLAVHCSCLAAALCRQARCSLCRARARRDITVPIGNSRISAMSRYDISSISRSTSISR